jgi:hypothetical protein
MLTLHQRSKIARARSLLSAGGLPRVDLFQIFAVFALAGWALRMMTT